MGTGVGRGGGERGAVLGAFSSAETLGMERDQSMCTQKEEGCVTTKPCHLSFSATYLTACERSKMGRDGRKTGSMKSVFVANGAADRMVSMHWARMIL